MSGYYRVIYIYLLAEDLKNGINGERVGRLFHDFYNEQCRLKSGDNTNSDLQGLLWKFTVAVEENRLDPAIATWLPDDIDFVQYILDNVLYCMTPDSPFYRQDLIR
jgi:hypothetical protein